MKTWLLVACVSLSIITGAHGILCRWCTIRSLGGLCTPPRVFCKVENGVCLVKRLFKKDGTFVQKEKSCYRNDSLCGTEGTDPESGFKYKYRCCSDSNNCSKNM